MIGDLRHRVKFLFPLQGRDETTGAEKQTIIESAEVWASVEFTAIGSDEMNTADKITPITAAKVYDPVQVRDYYRYANFAQRSKVQDTKRFTRCETLLYAI
jgi:hypothetical protein